MGLLFGIMLFGSGLWAGLSVAVMLQMAKDGSDSPLIDDYGNSPLS